LSINGAKGFAILFVYGLVVGLVTLLPAGVLFLLGAVLQSPVVSLLGTLIGGLLYLVGVIIIAVIAPIMVCNFVLTDELSAGFDIDVLQTLITNGTMLRAVGLAIVVNFLISIVSGILFFTIVGPAIVSFVGLSAVAYIWASGFADAYRAEYGDLPEIPEGPTKMGIDATAGAGTSAATSGAETATAGDGASTADATTAESATDESGSSDTDDDTSGPAPGDGQRWD